MNPAPWRSCLGVGQRKRACSRTYAASGVSGSNGLGTRGLRPRARQVGRRPQVAAARDRRQVRRPPVDARGLERLQRAHGEGGGPDPSAREADSGGVGRRGVGPRVAVLDGVCGRSRHAARVQESWGPGEQAGRDRTARRRPVVTCEPRDGRRQRQQAVEHRQHHDPLGQGRGEQHVEQGGGRRRPIEGPPQQVVLREVHHAREHGDVDHEPPEPPRRPAPGAQPAVGAQEDEGRDVEGDEELVPQERAVDRARHAVEGLGEARLDLLVPHVQRTREREVRQVDGAAFALQREPVPGVDERERAEGEQDQRGQQEQPGLRRRAPLLSCHPRRP